MNSTDFITTDGGERVDTRLHRPMPVELVHVMRRRNHFERRIASLS